jgi:GT2 family glycosyltransferase
MVTCNRRDEALNALGRLEALPERTAITLVDNNSKDGTAEAVGAKYPDVAVIRLDRNLGAVARNLGVALARTPYVAFSDDDSWWAPGALSRAADVMDAHPRLGLVAARILVGEEERLDPICTAMAHSPLPAQPGLPGPPILGFISCGTVVRRDAFLEAGGFSDLLFFFGEETLLAVDLAESGWSLCYVDDVVAHHHPIARGNWHRRRRLEARNALLSHWLRRPLSVAVARTISTAAAARRDKPVRQGLGRAMLVLPKALARRRVVSDEVERRLRLLEKDKPLLPST